MRTTSKKTFIIYFFLVSLIVITVSVNQFYNFFNKRIDFKSQNSVAKLISKISKNDLSFREALFYEVVKESDLK